MPIFLTKFEKIENFEVLRVDFWKSSILTPFPAFSDFLDRQNQLRAPFFTPTGPHRAVFLKNRIWWKMSQSLRTTPASPQMANFLSKIFKFFFPKSGLKWLQSTQKFQKTGFLKQFWGVRPHEFLRSGAAHTCPQKFELIFHEKFSFFRFGQKKFWGRFKP